jgi:adenosylhomocysteine nucleosidase
MGKAARMNESETPGTIAFICAMPMELRPLARKLSLHPARIGELRCRAGKLGDHRVIAMVTGMGTQLAAEKTTQLLEATPVARVVVVGITGGVDETVPIGSMVFPEMVVHAATGAEYRPAPLGDGTPAGTMWTSDALLTEPEVIAGLRARGVVSLDMETAAIAEVCERRGIPWSVFRAISDRTTDGSLDEEIFHLSHQDGTPDGQAVARYVLKHPGSIPGMVGLAKGAKLATETAADAAISAVSRL